MSKILELQDIGLEIVELITGDDVFEDFERILKELVNRFSFILSSLESGERTWIKIANAWANEYAADVIVVEHLLLIETSCKYRLSDEWEKFLIQSYPDYYKVFEKTYTATKLPAFRESYSKCEKFNEKKFSRCGKLKDWNY